MLSQVAADHLARVAKQITSAKVLFVPASGGQAAWEASTVDREGIRLHMRRGRKVVSQVTTQERYETNEILLRLDLDGPIHANPDGTLVPTPHLHIYQEGYEDKWAFPIPTDLDVSSGDPALILISFLQYCGVEPVPPVQGGVLP